MRIGSVLLVVLLAGCLGAPETVTSGIPGDERSDTQGGERTWTPNPCYVAPNKQYGAGSTGTLERNDGDDAVTVLADRLNATPHPLNETAFRVGPFTMEWHGGGTYLILWARDISWDHDQSEYLFEPFLDGADPAKNNPDAWETSWYDGDRYVEYRVASLSARPNFVTGALHGPLDDRTLIGLDEAWDATRDYGACMERNGMGWNWTAWEQARLSTDVPLDGHDDRLLYFLSLHSNDRWFQMRIDAETGELYAT